MEILFKSDEKIFYIEDDKLDWEYIKPFGDNYDDTPHINEFPIIYHLIEDNHKHPVYYEYKDRCVIFTDILNYYYTIIYYNYNVYHKDYTQANINNIINGDII